MRGPSEHPWRLAVIGAGPAGLALALQAARRLPQATITVHDARPLERDLLADGRTLALSQGSVQWLRQLGAWPAAQAEPIVDVQVSQAPPTLMPGGREAEVWLRAAELGVEQLGAVLGYGVLTQALQQAWLARAAAEPQRLHSRFGVAVSALKGLDGAVEVDAGVVEAHDLAIVAEGGVFAEQARKALRHDYGQMAWVGTVGLRGATRGLAVERFTRDGPVALLPLPAAARQRLPAGTPDDVRPMALVWCVPAADDPLLALDEAQRRHVLATRLPEVAGELVALGPLKRFALGLNAETTLVQGRTVRIGNAAQTLHPVAGQGLNLGLRDAAVLVQALREATPQTLDGALRRLEWARAPDRWSMIAATDFLARSFTWGVPGLATLRGLGLGALQALPPLKAALARQMMFGRR
ncbi:MAG: hypothetical protein RL223_3701 [Pseudomonadota bacterium]|jgi:2-octaprenyl-6-methoxyphenol hydroxylase